MMQISDADHVVISVSRQSLPEEITQVYDIKPGGPSPCVGMPAKLEWAGRVIFGRVTCVEAI